MEYLEIQPEKSAVSNLLAAASSSTSVASRLYMTSQRNSRRNSFSSEPDPLMSFNGNGPESGGGSDCGVFNGITFTDVSGQMSMMSKKLSDLQDLQLATSEEKSRLKTDNAVLQERVHLLEEQFQSHEVRWQEKLEEERARAKEQQQRWEREKQLVEESASLRYQVLQKDLAQLTRERDRLEQDMKESQQKAARLKDQLQDAQMETERHEREKNELKGEFDRFRRDAACRMDTSSEMLEEMSRQTAEMRESSLAHAFPHRQGSLTDQIILLEDEIERLRLENRELREHNDDLQAQLLHDSVECGRSLLADQGPSLAAELSGMDSQDLMNTLREQEMVNQRLRNYVNGILMRIIERHPDILEITDGEEKGGPANRKATNNGPLPDGSDGSSSCGSTQ